MGPPSVIVPLSVFIPFSSRIELTVLLSSRASVFISCGVISGVDSIIVWMGFCGIFDEFTSINPFRVNVNPCGEVCP